MINVGIIGYGKMGRIRHATLEQSGRAVVKAIHDCQSIPGVNPSQHVKEEETILEDPAIDAVCICTPNYRNQPLTIAALQAGKHVFCEKPPAFNAAGVEQIREVEVKSGCRLMYGFNHRHHDSIHKMKSIVDSQEMGKILWMRGRYGKEVNEQFFDGWRADPKLAGGGILLDQGIHMLDLFLYLGGRFDDVHAFVSNLFWKIDGIEDNVFAIFRSNETGICASLHSTMTQWRYIFSLEVFLEGGALILNGLKTSSGSYGDEDLAIKRNPPKEFRGVFQNEERLIFHLNNSWASEMDEFLNAIAHGAPVTTGNSRDALQVMKLMDKIYESKPKSPSFV